MCIDIVRFQLGLERDPLSEAVALASGSTFSRLENSVETEET